MFAKQFAAGLVATTLLSTAAFAQAPAPAAKDPPTGQSSSMPRADTSAQPVQTQSSSEWRTSKVVGLYVYNDANERLGSINDLLTDSSGKIAKAVIGVGGFLGIGESDVAVNFDQLKFVNEPMRTTTSSTTPAPAPATGASDRPASTVGTTATTTTTTASKPSINPDHAKLSMTKEQLKALPQFKYAN
jgi:sporulation protein YlmC with PRC-barrel domain